MIIESTCLRIKDLDLYIIESACKFIKTMLILFFKFKNFHLFKQYIYLYKLFISFKYVIVFKLLIVKVYKVLYI